MAKKVLITGKDSYVGTSFIKWMAEHEPEAECVEISVRGEEWKQFDFSPFDSVLHVAGIAHVNSKVFKDEDYYRVNTDLTIEVAEKAKQDGVPHFIFMSSIIVYNDSEIVDGMITKDTIPYSKNAYGDSKIKAEEGIRPLEDDNFKIAIVRPPMIYGPGSKGNYPRLAKLAKKTPIFPNYPNKRSMLFVENLSSFLNLIIADVAYGNYFPQNSVYTCTSKMVHIISFVQDEKIVFTKMVNPLISVLKNYSTFNKVFGNLYYDRELNDYSSGMYETVSLEQSIKLTEGAI